jgi:hypothetical protein
MRLAFLSTDRSGKGYVVEHERVAIGLADIVWSSRLAKASFFYMIYSAVAEAGCRADAAAQ